jgi:hypothetical protein
MKENQISAVRKADPRVVNATILIVEAVVLKEIAAHIAEPLKSSITTSAEKTISSIADEYCGTGTGRKPPKLLPGPRLLGVQLAISIAGFANIAAKSESLRSQLMQIAGDLTHKAYE